MSNEVGFFVHVGSDVRHRPAMIQHRGADIAATLYQAHYDGIVGLAAEASRTFGFAGARQFGFVGLYGLTEAAKLSRIAGSHRVADSVPKVPSGFHAAPEEALKLAGGDASWNCKAGGWPEATAAGEGGCPQRRCQCGP